MPPTIMDDEFQRILPREWKWIALRGAIAVVFGLVIFIWPLFWAPILFVVFSAFVFADGVTAFMVGWRMHKMGVPWWPYILTGVSGLLFGIIALFAPAIAVTAIIWIVAFWAIASGILQIVAAVRLRDVIDTEALMFISGVLSIIFGALLIFVPAQDGFLVLTVMTALFAVFYGVMTMLLAFRLRSLSDTA